MGTTTNRKSIPNSTRFEVFKRDSFTCQYCGAKSPDVVLNVDHINPVSNGGDNSLLNYITSCFECNSGKSDTLLSDTTVVEKQRKQLEDLTERRNQIEMMLKWKREVSGLEFEITQFNGLIITAKLSQRGLHPNDVPKLKSLIRKHGFEQVVDAFYVNHEKYGKEITLDRMSHYLSYITAPEHKKNWMYINGIFRNRKIEFINGFQRNEAYQQYLKSLSSGIDKEFILESAKNCDSIEEFLEIITPDEK